MDSAAAALIGAGIGVAGGWGAALITGRNQRSMALTERRYDAYVAALVGVHRLQDVLGLLTGVSPGGSPPDLEDPPSQVHQARALLAAVGSRKVRQGMDAVHAAIIGWQRASRSFPIGYPQGSAPPPGLDEHRAALTTRFQAMRQASIALEDRINDELTQ